MVTLGAIKAIIEKGLKIPENISLVGFFDGFYSPYLSTPLTTITHYRQKIGEKAFKLLLKQIETNKQNNPKIVCVDTKFEIRKSTAKPVQ